MAQQITGSDFEEKVLKASGVVLVDFFATWCGPCQAMMPVIEEVAAELPEGAAFYKIDVDQAPDVASSQGVMSIPTFRVFKNGEAVGDLMGMQSKEDLLGLITANL